jgi:6-phosphogluconate dehydrogenase
MIGLGKMGGNMSERLIRNDHSVIAFDRDPATVTKYQQLGAAPAKDLADVVRQLESPRVVWIMVPAGKPVDSTIDALLPQLAKGDILIDGGNSMYKETIARAERLAHEGIRYLDSGTSVGPSGAGHYVKMVHNGIEYGMLQAFAEGYEILEASKRFPDLDLRQIAELWQHGSVVRSWLNELAVRAFDKDARLSALKGYVADSGEGRWTVAEAIEEDVPAPVITLSLLMRLRSRQEDSFSAKVIAALRNEFGGHAVKES